MQSEVIKLHKQYPDKDLIGTTLKLSNCHVPDDGVSFEPFRSVDTEYGWIFWPTDPEALEDPDEIPGWLKIINEAAYTAGCTMVEFDADNLDCDLFERFEW